MKDGPKGLRVRRVCVCVGGDIMKCFTIEVHDTETTPLTSPIWRLNPPSHVTPSPPQGTLTPSTPNASSSTTNTSIHPHLVGSLGKTGRALRYNLVFYSSNTEGFLITEQSCQITRLLILDRRRGGGTISPSAFPAR